MKQLIPIFLLLLIVTSCHSQTEKSTNQKLVGGRCEGCEAIYEYGDKFLPATATLPGYQENSPKLKITGTVFKSDGKTPAENVILYIYQTNQKGIYETKGNEIGWGKRHGFIRGWVKTGKDGRYTFYTFRPASYPNTKAPQHIHLTVKEPDKNEYYLDEYVFDDDPNLTVSYRQSLPNRGGSGIVNPKLENGMLVVRRDLVLGLNIPSYE